MPRSSVVVPYLPERIGRLYEIATNLFWSWDRDARALFRLLDRPLWHLTRHNPLEQLRRMAPERLAECARDPHFLRLYDGVVASLDRQATNADTWFAKEYPALATRPIAYFCAEFGLHNSVPIYSGGLGVLAGDHCKAASDLGVPIGQLNEDGFQRMGAATGAAQPTAADGEPVALMAVHFAPKSVALDAGATTVVDILFLRCRRSRATRVDGAPAPTQPRGKPSRRWAIILRCTSDVPEAMVMARAISQLYCHCPSSTTRGVPRHSCA
jgi:hypothetical protein